MSSVLLTGETSAAPFKFVKTYLPLVARSDWYVLPAALVTTAVVADVLGSKLRRLKCLAPAAAPRQ